MDTLIFAGPAGALSSNLPASEQVVPQIIVESGATRATVAQPRGSSVAFSTTVPLRIAVSCLILAAEASNPPMHTATHIVRTIADILILDFISNSILILYSLSLTLGILEIPSELPRHHRKSKPCCYHTVQETVARHPASTANTANIIVVTAIITYSVFLLNSVLVY